MICYNVTILRIGIDFKGKSVIPMKRLPGIATVLFVVFGALAAAHAADDKITVVAAENFYGDVAQQIGGDSALPFPAS